MKLLNALVLTAALAAPALACPPGMDCDHAKGGMKAPGGHHGMMHAGPGMMAPGHGPMGAMRGQGGFEAMALMKAHHLLMLAGPLGLTEQQGVQIRAIALSAEKAVIQGRAELAVLGLDLRAEFHAQKPDAGRIKSLIAKKFEKKKELAQAAAESFLKIDGALTDDQKAHLKKMRGGHPGPMEGPAPEEPAEGDE